jgi:hypothetical protein
LVTEQSVELLAREDGAILVLNNLRGPGRKEPHGCA